MALLDMELPPHLIDLESERRVLSSMLHSEEACIEACNALQPVDFYSPQHGAVYELTRGLYEREVRPTYVELIKEAHSLGLLTTSREVEELRYIAEHYIYDGNIGFWIKKVRDRSRLRKFESFIRKSYLLLQDETERDVEQVLMEAEEELTNLTALEVDDRVDSAEELARLGYDEVERRFVRYKDIKEKFKGVIPLDGLPTGFYNLDKITLGYKPGDLIILGAQTGHGKTSFALHTANTVTVRSKHNLLYLNTEMSRQQIALRWGSILSGIEHERVRSGEINESELSQILQGYSQLMQSGFYSYPCPNLTPEKTISIARKFKAQKNIDMMIIDYIGRMDKQDPRLQEWQVLEQIVKTQKMIAQNLQIAVMCLVQLNPDGSLQGAKRMKNECDLMLKLSPLSKEELAENPQLKKYDVMPNYEIYVDKNRDGQSGLHFPIYFDLERQSMRDPKRVSV